MKHFKIYLLLHKPIPYGVQLHSLAADIQDIPQYTIFHPVVCIFLDPSHSAAK
jgi:hypothetical protein